MKKLHFKTPFYNFYSPLLFKLRKLHSVLLAKLWALPPEQTKQLILYNWDRYLANKFYSEVPYFPGQKINFNNIKRKSDTIFILGCGASINDLTENEWQIINQHDSIGVNYFYAHHFCPRFHMIELGQSPKSMACLNDHLLSQESRKNEMAFLQMRHLLRRDTVDLDDSNNNLYLYSPSVPKSTSVPLIRHILTRWFNKAGTLIHHASNLDCTVHFAHQLGYKKIYLLGVDLNNNQYFWDLMQANRQAIHDVKAATQDDYRISNFNPDPKAKHATADKKHTASNKSLTIVDYLTIINENIFSPLGIHFATCSPNSLLREHFDYVELSSLKVGEDLEKLNHDT
ncbi:hypothetical protein L0668_08345 [Paraglaciecola aquimarina]|uniref:DUF115 domain-containing protein n=1 Tax=Paraglaciecola algarum TaxID=3050085 RepID=A0ABS9D7X9_9ALTE|nr:hypothetical protein [Paraglaciecola sp. G1-23]MCF2948112.1 hypothetical protein [Paraglaciecola sp. G1-23]